MNETRRSSCHRFVSYNYLCQWTVIGRWYYLDCTLRAQDYRWPDIDHPQLRLHEPLQRCRERGAGSTNKMASWIQTYRPGVACQASGSSTRWGRNGKNVPLCKIIGQGDVHASQSWVWPKQWEDYGWDGSQRLPRRAHVLIRVRHQLLKECWNNQSRWSRHKRVSSRCTGNRPPRRCCLCSRALTIRDTFLHSSSCLPLINQPLEETGSRYSCSSSILRNPRSWRRVASHWRCNRGESWKTYDHRGTTGCCFQTGRLLPYADTYLLPASLHLPSLLSVKNHLPSWEKDLVSIPFTARRANLGWSTRHFAWYDLSVVDHFCFLICIVLNSCQAR